MQQLQFQLPPPRARILDPPQYTPYFANCDGAAVSFSARIAAYNLKPDGSRDYLAIGETELDVVYWVGGGWLRVSPLL